MAYYFYVYLAFFVLFVQQAAGFFAFPQSFPVRARGDLPVKHPNLVVRLDHLRRRREEVKRQIVGVIAEQRKYPENSAQFLGCEKEFMELLMDEDNILLEIEDVVRKITRHRTFSRNVATYIREA